MVWLPKDDGGTLPETPEMVVGTLLHRVRSRFVVELLRLEESRPGIETYLAEETAIEEARLTSDGQAPLVPLWRAVGRRRWMDRKDQLVEWAKNARPTRVGSRAFTVRSPGTEKSNEPVADRFELGQEPLWVSNRMRLRGCPDEAVLAQDGALEINDYKSGHVTDGDGLLLPSIVTQLQLYALMAEDLAPGTPLRLTVEHRRREPVPWSNQARDEQLFELDAMKGSWEPGQAVSSYDLARPGSHCIGCRQRPRCQRYLSEVPAWWPNTPSAPRPLPTDVWGTISSITPSQNGFAITLRDPADRLAMVEGLSESRRLESLAPGARLFLFNLEATEDIERHGVQVHPRNFHEASPGPPWRDALQARLFVVSSGDAA